MHMQMTPAYANAYADGGTGSCSQASRSTDLLLLPPFDKDSARIQEWCNHWIMILSLLKTAALVVSRSRTVNPLRVDMVLSEVSIRSSPNLDILGLNFDSSSHSKTMCVVLCLVSLSEQLFWGCWSVSFWTPLCYFIVIIHFHSQSSSIGVQCGSQLIQLLEGQVRSVVRLSPGHSFLLVSWTSCCWTVYVVQG